MSVSLPSSSARNRPLLSIGFSSDRTSWGTTNVAFTDRYAPTSYESSCHHSDWQRVLLNSIWFDNIIMINCDIAIKNTTFFRDFAERAMLRHGNFHWLLPRSLSLWTFSLQRLWTIFSSFVVSQMNEKNGTTTYNNVIQ